MSEPPSFIYFCNALDLSNHLGVKGGGGINPPDYLSVIYFWKALTLSYHLGYIWVVPRHPQPLKPPYPHGPLQGSLKEGCINIYVWKSVSHWPNVFAKQNYLWSVPSFQQEQKIYNQSASLHGKQSVIWFHCSRSNNLHQLKRSYL